MASRGAFSCRPEVVHFPFRAKVHALNILHVHVDCR